MEDAQCRNDGSEENREALKTIQYLTKNTKEVQTEVLSTILKRNKNTEYLRRFGLRGETDKASFKTSIPVVTYEDVEPDIQRIANGDTSAILCEEPISEFLTSSGTSAGERRLMPTTAEELDRKKFLYSLLMPVMDQYVPGLDKGKGLYFLFIKSETKTPGGLVARPVLTSYYKSRQFKDRAHDRFNVYTSPTETILCPDSYQSMYCQMLCGLLQYSEVLRVGAVFASGFLRAIKFLERHWQELCDDIRCGQLSPKITDPPSRTAVTKLLRPDSELADHIQAECSRDSWQGIINRLWPKARYIEVVVTGTMSQYIPMLDHYSGGLPLVCTMYASSECYFGLNLEPLRKPSEVSYCLLPNMAYFEFIPVERWNVNHTVVVKGHGELLDLTDLEVGKYYELVVTTYAGLYRYKVGDILRVTGFHNTAPQFQFVCRKNVILSIDSDKTDEDGLHQAVRNASKHLQTEAHANLIEYTSFPDTGSIPGHYVIFWEVQTPKPLDQVLLEECCLAMEESLDSVYRQCRNCDQSIGPLEIRVVEAGTFDMLMDYCVSRGSSINQYKTPRCIKSTSALDLLNARVTQRSFSPRCPFWAPQRRDWISAGS